MPGSSELLIIIAIVVLIFFIFPVIRKAPARKSTSGQVIPGKTRLAIVASIVWTALFAISMEPWKGEVLKFIYVGVAPIALSWAIAWVMAGFKKEA